MSSRNLSKIVDDQIEDLKKEWLSEVRRSNYLGTYKTFSDSETVIRGEAVFRHLSEWLKEGATNDSAEKYFESVGSTRFKERFPFSSLTSGGILLEIMNFPGSSPFSVPTLS